MYIQRSGGGKVTVELGNKPASPPPSHRAQDTPSANSPAIAAPFTSELSNLVQSLQSTPAIREDKLAEVSQKLIAGFYATPAALAQTARAMLGECTS